MGQMKKLAIDNVLESLPKVTDNPGDTVPEARYKRLSSHEAGSEPKIVIDDLCLALLLNTIYGQRIIGADWNEDRGDMLTFADNPIVRTCATLWDRVKNYDGKQATIERYLFSLLDYETNDLFHDIDNILFEKGYLKAIEDES